MDSPTMNGTAGMNTALPNLSELWSIPNNGVLEVRPGSFRPNFLSNRLVSGSADAGVARKRKEINPLEDDSPKGVCNAMSNCDGKRLKTTVGSGDDNKNVKADDDASSEKGAEQKRITTPELPKDYIHVRARRGQATDSHSLAERARREKISERMRILQDLVPGCNKVIGKALVLDEIINYIQSLQHQVEFLSMKLEAVNSRIAPYVEGFPAKDFGQQEFDTSRMVYSTQVCEPPREYGRDSSPEWLHLHMQLGGGFGRQT